MKYLFIATDEEMIDKYIESGNKRPKYIFLLNKYSDIQQFGTLKDFSHLKCYALDRPARAFIDINYETRKTP